MKKISILLTVAFSIIVLLPKNSVCQSSIGRYQMSAVQGGWTYVIDTKTSEVRKLPNVKVHRKGTYFFEKNNLTDVTGIGRYQISAIKNGFVFVIDTKTSEVRKQTHVKIKRKGTRIF